MSSIIVILECTKSTTKPSINFLRIRALHKEIKWPVHVWASRIRKQSMWCKSEVSLNKYMFIIIVRQTVLFLSEKFFHYWKVQYSDWGINREKKYSCLLHLVDCEENDNKPLHQRSRGVQTWSIDHDQRRTWKRG